MGYGKCGWVMAKGKETKEMRRWAPFGLEVSEQRSLRADCLENVPSVPGFYLPERLRIFIHSPLSHSQLLSLRSVASEIVSV